MNEPYRLRYTNQAVGIFLLVILFLLLAFSILVLRAGDYFVEKDHYWIEIPQEDIRDLYKGAEVMILGERAGEIESIRYIDATDQVRVNLSISPNMSNQIFADSIVRQDRKFGLGTPILMIRRGNAGAESKQPLPPGNQIRNYEGELDRLDKVTRQVETVSEAIRLIQEQLDPTLLSVTAASDQLRGTLSSSVEPAFDETRRAADSFYQTNETLRPKTMETLDTVQSATERLQQQIGDLTERVGESASSVQRAADSITTTTEQSSQNLAETLSSLRDAADEVRQLALQTQDLVRIVRREAEDLPGTTERFNETVSDTQQMVGEIRSHWLLRNSRQTQESLTPRSTGTRGGSVRP
jgi:phospholipid/cholesterol/gamma-HCH transport system substrate-binding protein